MMVISTISSGSAAKHQRKYAVIGTYKVVVFVFYSQVFGIGIINGINPDQVYGIFGKIVKTIF
jgi:hypothetical protein